MATLTNPNPVQMPGTAPPTPQVTSYSVVAARAVPTQGGFQIAYTITAFAADGTVVNPPTGWKIPAAVAQALQAAVQSALDAIGPVQLLPVLQSVGGYSPAPAAPAAASSPKITTG